MKAVYPREGCIEYESDRVIFKVSDGQFKVLWREGANWCELEQTFRIPVTAVDLSPGGPLSAYFAEYDALHKDSDLRMVLTGAKSFRDALK